MSRFSILIPGTNEEKTISRHGLDAIKVAQLHFPDQVEVIVRHQPLHHHTEEIALKYGAKVVV